MPIRESLWSGDPISLLAEVVVGSAFQVDAGRPAESVVVVACTARISYRQPRPVWTFDERQLSVLVVFKIVETLVFLRSDRRSRQSSFVRLVSAVGSPSAADTPIRRIFILQMLDRVV